MVLQFIEFLGGETGVLLTRMVINLIVITILIRFIYFGYKKDKEYAFTFFLFNVLIFFVCFVMLKSEISMGFAFGLFAIFGILRYRTNTIPHKEMTYLFTSITIALINGIAVMDETLIIMNFFILLSVFMMEKIWFSNKENYKTVYYEKIQLIQSGDRQAIIDDLKSRTALKVVKYEIRSMNFLNDSAELRVFFVPD